MVSWDLTCCCDLGWEQVAQIFLLFYIKSKRYTSNSWSFATYTVREAWINPCQTGVCIPSEYSCSCAARQDGTETASTTQRSPAAGGVLGTKCGLLCFPNALPCWELPDSISVMGQRALNDLELLEELQLLTGIPPFILRASAVEEALVHPYSILYLAIIAF